MTRSSVAYNPTDTLALIEISEHFRVYDDLNAPNFVASIYVGYSIYNLLQEEFKAYAKKMDPYNPHIELMVTLKIIQKANLILVGSFPFGIHAFNTNSVRILRSQLNLIDNKIREKLRTQPLTPRAGEQLEFEFREET